MNEQTQSICNHLCRCCMTTACPDRETDGFTRREFLAGVGVVTAGTLAFSAMQAHAGTGKDPEWTPAIIDRPLKVQPLLLNEIPKRREATSWRNWGGLHTAQDEAQEKERIRQELDKMVTEADFPIEMLPLETASNPEQAANVAKGDHDVMLIYGASCGTNTMEAAANPDKWTILFVRHRSGPVYLWYETAHDRFLRKTVDEYGQPGMDVQDVVVDRYDEILWRLRALHGIKNTLGKRIVAIGGPSGWGKGGQPAPDFSRNIFKWEIIDAPYPDLGERIKKARANDALVRRCHREAEKYMKGRGVSVHTGEDFIRNAFVLNEVFKELMVEAQTDSITVNNCMGTIMPMSETTACLPLTLLNDAGYTAFCESDFVVIPSGVLLHYISGKPVFLNDPTYPHDGVVTLAHCTAPRKMNGKNNEDVKIYTHFESDYGAAPKVEMSKGEKITVIDPDFAFKRWMGFEGEIIDAPFYDICRSQIDVQINGDCDTAVQEMRGFHWMVCYGNYLKETGYALKKVGIDWMNLSKA
ncbi:MAG TPA: sugar isomerase [bacterium]|nr:sugar isomerase [bacterium]HQL63473.1 sugar isomerase [bacterium]